MPTMHEATDRPLPLASVCYAEEARVISQRWQATVVSPFPWESVANQAGAIMPPPAGEAGGFFVTSPAIAGRRAYLKPTRRDEQRQVCHAAREKIASDLAYHVGVQVPPVLLYLRPDSAANEENHCCVSLVMYPRQFSWGQIRDLLADQNLTAAQAMSAQLPQAAADALAFDTWVDQTDHADHPYNIIYGFNPNDPSDAAYVFLDYSYSLGANSGWADGTYKGCHPAPFPPLMLASSSPAALNRAVQRIEGCTDRAIREIVERIPDDFLALPDRDLISRRLIERRSHVREALRDNLQERK